MKTLLALGSLVLTFILSAGAEAKVANLNCYIQTYNGRYLTAVGGGGRTTDVIHSDAKQAKSWEKFTLVDADRGTPVVTFGIRTKSGHFLNAINGGGRITDVMHSNATEIRAWEEFQFNSLGGGWFTITTYNGNYLTAVGGGGRITDVIHSDARQVGNWEKFRLTCGV